MSEPDGDKGFVDRLSRGGEEALGKLAEELIGNSVVNSTLARAFEAREKAVQAQEAALGALNIPSAADVERLTRRLRSVSQRLEGIEDALDRIEERVPTAKSADEDRLGQIERRLDAIAADVAAVRESLADRPAAAAKPAARGKSAARKPAARKPAKRS